MKFEPIIIGITKTTTYTGSDGVTYSSEFECRKAEFMHQAKEDLIKCYPGFPDEMIKKPRLLWKFFKHMRSLQAQYKKDVLPYLEAELPF